MKSTSYIKTMFGIFIALAAPFSKAASDDIAIVAPDDVYVEHIEKTGDVPEGRLLVKFISPKLEATLRKLTYEKDRLTDASKVYAQKGSSHQAIEAATKLRDDYDLIKNEIGDVEKNRSTAPAANEAEPWTFVVGTTYGTMNPGYKTRWQIHIDTFQAAMEHDQLSYQIAGLQATEKENIASTNTAIKAVNAEIEATNHLREMLEIKAPSAGSFVALSANNFFAKKNQSIGTFKPTP